MKYHKIPGVEKTLCTAEQKIAYNYASAYYDTFYKEYKIQVTEQYKHDVLIDFRDFCMDAICKNEKITKKYDIDSIFFVKCWLAFVHGIGISHPNKL